MRDKPLTVWTVRHKVYGFLSGGGDIGEHSSMFSTREKAEHERTTNLITPDEFEVVELVAADDLSLSDLDRLREKFP